MYLYLHLELKYKHSIYAALLQVADAAGVEGLLITGKATRLQTDFEYTFSELPGCSRVQFLSR